jgi:hypothetical protein
VSGTVYIFKLMNVFQRSFESILLYDFAHCIVDLDFLCQTVARADFVLIHSDQFKSVAAGAFIERDQLRSPNPPIIHQWRAEIGRKSGFQ